MVGTYTIISLLLSEAVATEENPPPFSDLSSVPLILQKVPKGTGLGVFLGAPAGLLALNLSFRTELSTSQLAVGGNWGQRNLRLSLDQLWQIYTIPSTNLVTFPISVGFGGGFQFNERGTGIFGNDNFYNRVGVRSPIIMTMHHEELAIDVYGEIAPALNFISGVSFSVQGGIGTRFYFF